MIRFRTAIAGLAALGLIAAIHTSAFAQPGPGGQGRMDPARMVDRMITNLNTQLNLTADQQKKIRAIYDESFKSMQNASRDTTMSRRDRLVAGRNQNQQNRFAEIDAKIKKVLTAEQVKKYEAMPRPGRGGFGGGDPASRIERLDQQVTLTADQKKKLLPIFEKSQANMDKMRESMQDSQDRDARRAAYQKEQDRFNKELEAVLTADQVKKYRAAQEQMRQQFQNRQGQGQGQNQGQGGNR
jgi:periplasmic protein CpxP/Spy